MSSDRIFCLWQKESSDLLISQHECYCSRHTSSSVWVAKKDYVFFKLRWKLLDRLSHSFFSSCPVWFFGKQWIFASASSVVEGRFLKGSFLFYKKLLHSCGECVRIKFQDNEPMVAQAPIVLSDMETRTQVLFQHGIRASTGVNCTI